MSNTEIAAGSPPGGSRAAGVPWSGRPRVTARGIQIALGAIWLLDGLFQFKNFMYTHAIVSEVFAPAAEKQPHWVASSMRTFDNFYGHDLTLWNTLSAQVQIAIGLGLIVGRKWLKPALAASFGWAIVVWWFGEGFGGLISNTLPAPLMGEPGAVILYALIGLLVWPSQRGEARSPAGTGPLGELGGQLCWCGLWLLGALLWLVNVNRAKGATSEMIKGMAEASPHWLAKIQNWAVHHTAGHGGTIAIVLAILSVAIAFAVFAPPPIRWAALALSIVISLAYWLFGQSIGGPFWTEGATDLNAAPLFVLLAVALFPVTQPAPAAEQSSEPLAASAAAPQVSMA